MNAPRTVSRAVLIATMTSVAMIAFQMGAKATRDALFLTSYDVSALPLMVMGSAAISLALAFLAARRLTALGPARFVPGLFLLSAALLVVEWLIVRAAPGPAAILVYVHYGALGALVVSGFWSLVAERFDPRTAKREIGRIASGGTVGGLLGGVLAERVAVVATVETMLPLLAALHVICAWLSWRLGAGAPRHREPPPDPRPGIEGGLAIIARSPYLRTLVALVFVTTMAEGLIDWVFKAQATATVGRGDQLLRLFAVFYTGVGLITVAVQAVASRAALQRFGLARTVATLPGTVALGSVGALFAPGLGSAVALRGAESILRNGLYRPAYELLFSPIAPARKRATKALMDVSVVRLGDIGGGALVQAVLLVAAAAASSTLLGVAATLSLLGIVLAVRLHRGYVRSLERSLVAQGGGVEQDSDALTRTALLQSTAMLHLSAPALSLPDSASDDDGPAVAAPQEPAPTTTAAPGDPVVARIAALRSGDETRVRRALAAGPLTPDLVPHAIRLLAWDAVMSDAVQALRGVAGRATGQLVDRLLDPEEEFSIRRRIPLVLAAVPTERAFLGLFDGLVDRRFEVRYRCGRALLKLQEHNRALRVDRDRAIAAILREMAVDRGVWESHRLLDRVDADDSGSPIAGAVLRDRANRSLEHVFTVLALILPREPLAVAFRALHTDDAQLRGTALEYLETALPDRVREQLWPFLEEDPQRPLARRSAEEALRDLIRSNESIAYNLETLRRWRDDRESGRRGTDEPDAGAD